MTRPGGRGLAKYKSDLFVLISVPLIRMPLCKQTGDTPLGPLTGGGGSPKSPVDFSVDFKIAQCRLLILRNGNMSPVTIF